MLNRHVHRLSSLVVAATIGAAAAPPGVRMIDAATLVATTSVQTRRIRRSCTVSPRVDERAAPELVSPCVLRTL